MNKLKTKITNMIIKIKFTDLSLFLFNDKLTSLTTLTLNDYDEPLNNSLDNLTSLTTLTLYSYNLQLNNSLDNLKSLTTLTVDSYNKPLNNSLDKLTSLKKLFLNYYNNPLPINKYYFFKMNLFTQTHIYL